MALTDVRTADQVVNNLNINVYLAVMLTEAKAQEFFGMDAVAGPHIFAETDVDGGKIKHDRGAEMTRNENSVITQQSVTRDEWMRECTIHNQDHPGVRNLLKDMETTAYTFRLVMPGVPDPDDGTPMADVYALRNGRVVAGFEKSTSPGVRKRAIVIHGSRTMTQNALDVENVDPADETAWPDTLADVMTDALDPVP